MPRAMWSGSITFGLVNVPVKLFPAVRDRSVHFHMLSKDGTCRLRRKLVCPETDEEVPYNETDALAIAVRIIGDGEVSLSDMLELFQQWGPCQGCSADLNGDGVVTVGDLLMLLTNWGPCN